MKQKEKATAFIFPRFHVDEFRFNILFGLLSLLILPLLSKYASLDEPKAWMGIFGLIIYFSEAWATYYKLIFSRAAIIWTKSNANFMNLNIQPAQPGTMIWFAFIMRFCLRFAIVIFSIMAFGYDTNKEDPPAFIIVTLCIAVLFEIFIMMVSLFETRVFSSKSEYSKNPEEEERESETAWRKRMLEKVKDKNHKIKIQLADFIIIVTATIGTNLFWNPMNNTLLTFLDDQHKNGSFFLGVSFFLFTAIVMGGLFLLPLKISYWTESAMLANNKLSKLKYWGSFLFAVFSLLMPCVLFIIKSLFNT